MAVRYSKSAAVLRYLGTKGKFYERHQGQRGSV